MDAKKFFPLEPIIVGDKKIIPIGLLKIMLIKDTFFNVDYEISLIKIIENKKIYYKNVNLAQKDFEHIINNFQV